jgi:ribosomal protein S12 methylthiotransferase
MTVEKFDPKQTTTLDTPKKIISELSSSKNAAATNTSPKKAPRIGFCSLGCLN